MIPQIKAHAEVYIFPYKKSTQSPMGNKVCGLSSEQNLIGKGIDSEADNQGPMSYIHFLCLWDSREDKKECKNFIPVKGTSVSGYLVVSGKSFLKKIFY